MRRSDSPTLGIDLHEGEIRVVLTGVKAGKPFLAKTGSAPLPPGAIASGIVMEAGTVGVALRRVLESMGSIGSARAVIGVSGEQTGFRNLAVPPCPDAELPSLIEGEMLHQGLLRNDGSPYDFFRLFPPTADASDAMTNVAVVGVDGQVTLGLREVVEGAGVSIDAIEPTPLALLRTAAAGIPAGGSAFVLVVGPSLTDAAFFVGGRLAAFRRLEVGTDSLVQTFVPTTGLDDPLSMFGAPGAAFIEEESSLPNFHIDHASVDRLAVEAQRTMEYIQRADRDATAIDRILLAVEMPELESLAPMLERRFGIQTVVIRPPSSGTGEAEGDVRFATAYGLATHASSMAVAMPSIDLFSNQRTEAKHEENRRNFLGSMLVAALGISVGIAASVLYNRQIARVEFQAKSTTEQITEVRERTDQLLTARADAEQRYNTLRKEGVPLGTLMDYIVGSIDPGIGLKLVTVGEDLKVRIAGEAKDEAAVVRTTQMLQRSPVLKDLSVERFARDDEKQDSAGVLTFELTGQTVSSERIGTSTPKKVKIQ